jgi:hypothetical protein
MLILGNPDLQPPGWITNVDLRSGLIQDFCKRPELSLRNLRRRNQTYYETAWNLRFSNAKQALAGNVSRLLCRLKSEDLQCPYPLFES